MEKTLSEIRLWQKRSRLSRTSSPVQTRETDAIEVTGKVLTTYLTQDETKRLFSAIKNKRDRAIFLTACRHGLRLYA